MTTTYSTISVFHFCLLLASLPVAVSWQFHIFMLFLIAYFCSFFFLLMLQIDFSLLLFNVVLNTVFLFDFFFYNFILCFVAFMAHFCLDSFLPSAFFIVFIAVFVIWSNNRWEQLSASFWATATIRHYPFWPIWLAMLAAIALLRIAAQQKCIKAYKE